MGRRILVLLVLVTCSGCLFKAGADDDDDDDRNARTNNGTNAATNGTPNGDTNGAINGATNGATNGSTNGATNGATNGETCLTIDEACSIADCGTMVSNGCEMVQCPDCTCDSNCPSGSVCRGINDSETACCPTRETLCDELGPGMHDGLGDGACRDSIVCGEVDVPPFSMVAAGGAHTCGVVENNPRRVWCWGSNDKQQFGRPGDDHVHPFPAQQFPGPVTAIDAGGTHTCVISNDDVWCWGGNGAGQLVSPGNEPRQIDIPAQEPVRSIAAGTLFTCAATEVGDVYCWGDNRNDRFGQVGPDEISATQIIDTAGSPILSTGELWSSPASAYVCGHVSDSLYCWGILPMGVGPGPGASAAVELERQKPMVGGAGTNSVMAVLEASDAITEYADDASRIANFANYDFGLVGADKLDVSDDFACALDGNAALWCAGANDYGQAGVDMSDAYVEEVKQVEIPDVRDFALGGRHGCAIVDPNEVVCWGRNTNGQLGTGDTNDSIAPLEIADTTDGT